MTTVTGANVFDYIGFGFFVCVYSLIAVACILTGITSVLRNRLLRKRDIIITCTVTFIISMCKVIQMGALIVNLNVSNTRVIRGFAGVQDIMGNLMIPMFTLLLAYIHLYYLTKETILAIKSDEVSERTTLSLVKEPRRILFWSTVAFCSILFLVAIPTMTIKILNRILQTNGLARADVGMSAYFDQVFLYHMGAIGIVAALYFDKARDAAQNISDNRMIRKVQINTAYLVVFEMYNLYTYIAPGNVLLIVYLVGTLFLVSAILCNRQASIPYAKEHERVNQAKVNQEMHLYEQATIAQHSLTHP